MNLKTSAIISFFLLFATTAHAVTIYPLPVPWYERPILKVRECKLNIKCYFTQKLGVTITTIQGTDTLSASRTTINNNFSNLNAGKVENSTTSMPYLSSLAGLSTVGTISTGIWNGTAIPVVYGGSGTTSPSRFQVILGDKENGFTIASGTGSLGQFLTSNGANSYPSWQTSAVNQGDNYSWTGTHLFNSSSTTITSTGTGTTTIANNLSVKAASTTNEKLWLNGIGLSVNPQPLSTFNASNTVPTLNANGNISFIRSEPTLLGETITTGAQRSATVTLMSFGATSTRKDLTVIIDIPGTSAVTPLHMNFNNNDGGQNLYSYNSASTTLAIGGQAGSFIRLNDSQQGTRTGRFTLQISNNASVRKFVLSQGVTNDSGTDSLILSTISGVWNNTSQQIDTIQVFAENNAVTLNTGTRITVWGSRP